MDRYRRHDDGAEIGIDVVVRSRKSWGKTVCEVEDGIGGLCMFCGLGDVYMR